MGRVAKELPDLLVKIGKKNHLNIMDEYGHREIHFSL
jgi:hypothetical protein